MLSPRAAAVVEEVDEEKFKRYLDFTTEVVERVAHEITASLLEGKFGLQNLFSREPVILQKEEILLAAIPQFRVDVKREFSQEEMKNAKFAFSDQADFSWKHPGSISYAVVKRVVKKE